MGGEGFGPHDERESLRVLQKAHDNGLRHFDTAGFYAHGKSEILLQKIIGTVRQELFISTKGGLIWSGNNVRHSASPESLRQQLYESMERLKTDYIDLYQLHWPDPDVPIATSIAALKEFKKEGLILNWGLGNLTEEELTKHLTPEKNIPHQVHFNPLHNTREVLDAGMNRCISCIISPLEQGLLGSGISSHGIKGISKKDYRNKNPYYCHKGAISFSHQLTKLTDTYDISKTLSILLWICAQPGVHAVISGARKTGQLEEILRFKSEVLENDYCSDKQGEGILAPEKVRAAFPEKLWNLLGSYEGLNL